MNDEELREREKNTKWYQWISDVFKEDDVFWNNEIKANIFVSNCLIMLIVILLISWVLTKAGVFDVPISQMTGVLLINVPLLLIGVIITTVFKGQKHWIKYVLCILSISVSIALCSVISIFVTVIICVPVVLSCRYYSRKFTNMVAGLTIIGMAISEVVYAKGGLLDLNLVSGRAGNLTIGDGGLRAAMLAYGYDENQYLIDLFRGSFMPRLLLFSLVAVICSELSRRAHEMVLEQAEVSQKTEGMKAELNMATTIQESVLPRIFPAFPTRPDLDIRASMSPAKEVGGDFYDYVLLDDDHVMLVMADVSGKGVPAALFMMISKMLISTYAGMNQSPEVIASQVNSQLFTNNKVDMFVTAWIGVLEISTGIFTAVDAGHEYPIVMHKDGKYEMMKDQKSFVLGGVDDMPYKQYSFEFHRGDRIFLYTDGVTEATNKKDELYGMDRLLAVLNRNLDIEPADLLSAVREDIDAFVKDAPQFDDITMLTLYFREER